MAKGQKTMNFTSKNGNEFVFQKVGAAAWLDFMDQSENPQTGRPSHAKLNKIVLENVVVKPQLTLDDFDSEPYDGFPELAEVTNAAMRFQQGQ